MICFQLNLVEKRLVTDQIVLTIGYDIENLSKYKYYQGEITTDYYGRKIPKHAHGTVNLNEKTASAKLIIDAVMKLYDKIIDKNLTVKRINISANHVVSEATLINQKTIEQLDLFTDYEALKKQREKRIKRIIKRKKVTASNITNQKEIW